MLEASQQQQQQQQPTPSDDQQQQQQQASSSSNSRHARRRRAAAHIGGRSCRWHHRRGSERANSETRAMFELQTRLWPAKLHWGDLIYPRSSGGTPTRAARPPRHGARPLMHETPLATCNYRLRRSLLQLRTPPGGARKSQVSPVQCCRPYSLCGRALLSFRCFTALSRIASASTTPPAAIACCCRACNAS